MNWTVEEFLRHFHEVLLTDIPRRVLWDDAPRRYDEIADLGLTRPQVKDEILKLMPAHHHSGPQEDDWANMGSCVHKFRYPLSGGPDVYVKISLVEHRRQRGTFIAKIWSFKRWRD